MNRLAEDIKLSPDSGFRGFGKLGLENVTDTSTAGDIFNNFLSSVIGIITIIGFIWFVFLVITGALSIMTSGGDKAKAESARQRLTTGLVGLVILIAAVFIIDLVGKLLGIENILDPATLLNNISPSQ